MGADRRCCLIVALLDDGELAELHQIARKLGMAALVEVHDGSSSRWRSRIGPQLVGVNQRDLHSFEVDRERAERLARQVQPVC